MPFAEQSRGSRLHSEAGKCRIFMNGARRCCAVSTICAHNLPCTRRVHLINFQSSKPMSEKFRARSRPVDLRVSYAVSEATHRKVKPIDRAAPMGDIGVLSGVVVAEAPISPGWMARDKVHWPPRYTSFPRCMRSAARERYQGRYDRHAQFALTACLASRIDHAGREKEGFEVALEFELRSIVPHHFPGSHPQSNLIETDGFELWIRKTLVASPSVQAEANRLALIMLLTCAKS